jgi:hypothetical protein
MAIFSLRSQVGNGTEGGEFLAMIRCTPTNEWIDSQKQAGFMRTPCMLSHVHSHTVMKVLCQLWANTANLSLVLSVTPY